MRAMCLCSSYITRPRIVTLYCSDEYIRNEERFEGIDAPVLEISQCKSYTTVRSLSMSINSHIGNSHFVESVSEAAAAVHLILYMYREFCACTARALLRAISCVDTAGFDAKNSLFIRIQRRHYAVYEVRVHPPCTCTPVFFVLSLSLSCFMLTARGGGGLYHCCCCCCGCCSEIRKLFMRANF